MSERSSFDAAPVVAAVEQKVENPYRLVDARTESIVADLLRDAAIQKHLADLKAHHPASYEHCVRVGTLCVDEGLENNLPPAEIKKLGAAGLLHDLGKCCVSVELLDDPRQLGNDSQEKVELQRHVRAGMDKLKADAEFGDVIKIIAGHHELQPEPYPRRAGDRRTAVDPAPASSGDRRGGDDRRAYSLELAALTELLVIADKFDALASVRAYKGAKTLPEIKAIFKTEFTGNPAQAEKIFLRHVDYVKTA